MRPPFATTYAAVGSLVALSSLVPTVDAWGAAGHEIIATIAQIHLHPSVLPTVCALLGVDVDPEEDPLVLRSQCHMSTIATWADKYRMRMRWSAAMHYVGAVDDFPRERCAFPGDQGWAGTRSVNVLDGLKNVTRILADWSGVEETDLGQSMRTSLPVPGPLQEEAFKFLVHFAGDMHQPLHLTGRARGGNGIKVRFGNRHTNLHSAWDTSIPAKLIRTVPRNYTRPLPDLTSVDEPSLSSSYFSLRGSGPAKQLVDDEYPGYNLPSSFQIESALRGTIYDALIRRIMWEGVRGRWAIPDTSSPDEDEHYSEVDTWGLCPQNSTVPTYPTSFAGDEASQVSLTTPKAPTGIDADGPLICPYAWTQPIHNINCQYIWPAGVELMESQGEDGHHDHSHPDNVLDELAEEFEAQSNSVRPPLPPSSPQPDLDIPSYMGPLEREMVLEKLMVQGGLRLAGILNWLFADWEE